MNDHVEQPGVQSGLWPWILAVLMLLYPLSMGPFWGLREHGAITRGSTLERSLVTFYSPLDELAQLLPPFKALMKSYLELFGPV